MKSLVIVSIVCFSMVASAQFRRHNRNRPAPQPPQSLQQTVHVDVRGQSYFPDEYTARAICLLNNHVDVYTFTQFKQAGNIIEGRQSPDGRPFFQVSRWGGGYALDTVVCFSRPTPITFSVRGQSYSPDQMTALALCARQGKSQLVTFDQFKQAGNAIEGQKSYDGRTFSVVKFYGGYSIDTVTCQ